MSPILTTGAGKFPAIVGGAYTGPGNVVSGASAWWGLRAYNAATTGTSAADVDGDTTVTVFTFVTKSDGTLELSAGGAAAFIAANPGQMRIKQLYDQTGNTRHLIAAGAARPFFTPSGVGSFAVATFNSATHKLATASGFAVSQPFSTTAAVKFTAHAGIVALLSDSTGAQFLINTTPALRVQSNTALNHATTLSDNTWYRLQGVFNNTSSVATVNNADTTGTAGSNGLIAGHVATVGNDDFGEVLPGALVEVGIWPSGFSSGDRGSMDSNISVFWGI